MTAKCAWPPGRYMSDDVSSVVTPNKQLQGFIRVSLAPNEVKAATVVVDVATQLRLLNRECEAAVPLSHVVI